MQGLWSIQADYKQGGQAVNTNLLDLHNWPPEYWIVLLTGAHPKGLMFKLSLVLEAQNAMHEQPEQNSQTRLIYIYNI